MTLNNPALLLALFWLASVHAITDRIPLTLEKMLDREAYKDRCLEQLEKDSTTCDAFFGDTNDNWVERGRALCHSAKNNEEDSKFERENMHANKCKNKCVRDAAANEIWENVAEMTFAEDYNNPTVCNVEAAAVFAHSTGMKSYGESNKGVCMQTAKADLNLVKANAMVQPRASTTTDYTMAKMEGVETNIEILASVNREVKADDAHDKPFHSFEAAANKLSAEIITVEMNKIFDITVAAASVSVTMKKNVNNEDAINNNVAYSKDRVRNNVDYKSDKSAREGFCRNVDQAGKASTRSINIITLLLLSFVSITIYLNCGELDPIHIDSVPISQLAVKRTGDFDMIDEGRLGQSGSDMTDKRLRYKPTSKVNGLQAEIPNVGHHDLNTHTINFRDEFASRVRGKAVEIGTFDGNFASNNIAKFKGDYFMVDIAVRPKLQERLVAWKENPQVHFLKMTSQLASTKFGDKTLDWIYVDARHDYKSVLEDIQNWWPKLKPGGLFSGHDYCVSKNELGTYQDVPWCGCCYADGRNYASQVASVKAVREFARSKGLKICHTMEGRKDVADSGKGASWWYCGSALESALLTTEDTVKSNVLQAEIPDVDSPEGDHHPEGAFDEAEWCKTHNVLPNGAFCSKKYAGMDAPLATALLSQIPTGSSVCDLGAGGGWYTDFFNKHELTSHAYDASPTRASHVEYLDLTKPLNDHKECDWTLCLEVGEHVPSSTNNIFLDNIDKFSKHGVILSWAVPGQGGNGHINCQTNEWVIEKMQSRGFKYDKEASTRLRNAASFGWFKNTVMVFSKLTEVLTSCTWQQEFPPEKINCDVAQSTQICKVYESIATMYSWNDGNGYMDEGYFHKNLIGPLVSGAVLTLIRDGRFNYGSSDNDVDLPYASPALLPKIKAQAKSIRVSPEAVDRNKDFFEYNCICALPNGGTALCLEDSLAYARLEYGPSWWIPDLLIKSWFNYGAVKLITEKWVTPAVNSIKKYDKNDDGEITPDEVPIPERLKGKLTAFDLTQGIRQMNMILSGDARKIPDLPYKHAVLIGRNNDLSNKLREIGFRVYFLTKDIDKNTSIMRALNFLKGNLFSGTDRDSDTKIVFSVFLDSFQTKDMDLVKRIYESNFETSPDFETTPDVFFVSSSGVNKLIKTIEMKMKKNQ